MSAITLFNYDQLSAPVAVGAKAAAERIRLRLRRTAEDIIEIGRDLISVKKDIGHGNFLPWIDAEFGMSDQTARRFMQVAGLYGGKSNTVLNLEPSALYALAAPSTPADVRSEVEARAAEGEDIKANEIKRLTREKAEAERREKQARQQAEKAVADAADLRGQVATLKENVDFIRKSARDEARAEAAVEIEKVKAEADAVREQVEAAVKAQAEAAAKVATAKAEDDVKEARRKEREARAAVESLEGKSATLRKRIAEHEEYLRTVNSADVEAKALLEEMEELSGALTLAMVQISDLEHEHPEHVLSKVRSVAGICRRAADAFDMVGRARISRADNAITIDA